MNAGIYLFKRRILNKINLKTFSIEDEIIPDLIKKKSLNGVYTNSFFIDIGTESNLHKAKEVLPVFFKKPAVFFDRDGVINCDTNYVYKVRDFKFKKNILKTLKYLIKKDYYIFIITNQAGIAKKKFSLNGYLGGNYDSGINFSNSSGESTDDTQRAMTSYFTGENQNLWQYYNLKTDRRR